MKTMINKGHVSGLLYSHNLEMKVTGPNSKAPGTEYITGSISIATDDAITNIVPVYFQYVTATTSTGKPNDTFGLLKQIVDGVIKTHMDGGAVNLRIDGELGLNEFYTKRDGQETFVSAKRFVGRFVHLATVTEPEDQRNVFEVDMLITGLRTVEATETKPEKNILKGCIFNYAKKLLPVEFTIDSSKSGAVSYFENLEPSSSKPVFTKIRVKLVSETIVQERVEESAFGDSYVTETTSSRKDWVCYWSALDTYDWDSEETITAKEVTDAMAVRETELAAMKQAYIDRTSAAPAAKPQASNFNF